MNVVSYVSSLLLFVVISGAKRSDKEAVKQAMESVNGMINSFNFSPDLVNDTCVSASCPTLTDPKLCPLKADGSEDVDVIQNSLLALGDCFRTQHAICNISLDNFAASPPGPNLTNTNLTQANFTLDSFIPPDSLSITADFPIITLHLHMSSVYNNHNNNSQRVTMTMAVSGSANYLVDIANDTIKLQSLTTVPIYMTLDDQLYHDMNKQIEHTPTFFSKYANNLSKFVGAFLNSALAVTKNNCPKPTS